jgi:metal-sulfur cluster biosynthetic enzyme
MSAGVTRERVTEALRGVLDPELGMSVVDLGLIYDVRIEGEAVFISMTLTAQGCPLHEAMTEWVKQAVAQIPGVDAVDVALTFDPPWTPDRIAAVPRLPR